MSDAINSFIYIANDNLLRVDGLIDVEKQLNADPSPYLNAATVTARVTDLNDVDVTGQAWPLALSYIAGTDGNYSGILEQALVLVDATRYKIHVDVTEGLLVAHFESELPATVRDLFC